MGYCQRCGRSAPTKKVELYQNIGALVVRFHKSTKGNLCKSCISQTFWSYSATTFVLGWWGLISLVVTPFMLVNNVVYYIGSLSLPAAYTQARTSSRPKKIPTKPLPKPDANVPSHDTPPRVAKNTEGFFSGYPTDDD